MTKKDLQQFSEAMVQVFNDGCEQVIFPRLEQLQEEIEEKFEKKLQGISKELREEFQRGQKSLSNRLEEMEIDMTEVKKNTSQTNEKIDSIIKDYKDYGMRLDKVERIVKAN